MLPNKVFISSVYWGLQSVREQLYDWAKASGYEAWVFEKSEPDLGKTSPQNIQRVCLQHVDNSSLYVAIFHEGYGSSAEFHLANVSLVDLEFFEAFKEGKPMLVYILEPFTPVPELKMLLTVVSSLLPESIIRCSGEKELLTRIKRDIDRHLGRKPKHLGLSWEAGLLRQFLCSIALHRRRMDEEEGIRFLAGKYPQPTGRGFDKYSVKEGLTRINDLKNYPQVLNASWEILEELFEVPWYEKQYSEHLMLWDEVLGCWDRASAWCGLHGPLLLGKLAADNTLLAVRSLIASHGEQLSLNRLLSESPPRIGTKEEWVKLYSLGGAIASEYYSIAKSVTSGWARKHYLLRAEAWLRVAERASDMERNPKRDAGLAAIRGHVNLRLGNLRESKNQFELSLRLREEHSMGAGSIAEAQADLGYVLRRFGKKERAEELLLKGVKGLEKAMSPGFAARAKRKLARYYLEGGNLREAVRQLTQTQALCRKYGLHDQFEESLLLRLPLWLGTRVWRDLQTTEVIETAAGYEYVSPTRSREEPRDI
ncbi:MAG: DUF4062 domain-containing protein [Candidatus Brocadiales bacterium]|nr:DUF4062 domain-containing protein [Candidatus Brocadiales bacterium]